jgi:two-component system, NarL family, invasion response regulator UvrY
MKNGAHAGPMLSILIVDDHPVVRKGLKQILSEEYPGVLFGEAGSGLEAMAEAKKRAWDIVILDIGIPGMSGLEILKELLGQRPEMRILVLTMYPEEQYATRFLRTGAAGYMTKDRAGSELVRAVRMVLNGGQYITPHLANKIGLDRPAPAERLHETLSERELRVMLGLAAGKRLTDIAREMNLSIKTVSTYKRRILDKMHMQVNAELTRYAIEHCLI